ncbi:NUDIX domain-containing protein [Candidatus Woesearchaeota archaeon]|nr:NUDIX domain-containing protein [Candidatus Woesearchaeota archaeon]
MNRNPRYLTARTRLAGVRYIDEVDKFDKVIGTIPYDEAHKTGAWHRSVHIFIFDNEDLEELLLQLRSGKKKQGSLQYQTSAAGHVDEGETYKKAGYRETREELAFGKARLPKGLALNMGPKIINRTRFGSGEREVYNREHIQIYWGISPEGKNTEYFFDRAETEALLWKPIEETKRDLENEERRNNYTPDFRNVFAALRGHVLQK